MTVVLAPFTMSALLCDVYVLGSGGVRAHIYCEVSKRFQFCLIHFLFSMMQNLSGN